MRNSISTIILLAIFFVACEKEDVRTGYSPIEKDTIRTVISDLKFKLFPESADEFKFQIDGDLNTRYEMVLKRNGEELLKSEFVRDEHSTALYSTDVTYDFSPDKIYSLLIQSMSQDDSTVFEEEFTINNYQHIYLDNFVYEKLVDINQRLEFDISPSRKTLFFEDYVNNKPILKRLRLEDNKLEVLNEDFPSTMVRSKDDDHLIIKTHWYEGRFLGGDSCAISEYDLATGESLFLDFGYSDYGRFSRVQNNSIFISKPGISEQVTRIDLSDHSTQSYPVSIWVLRENSFDNVYWRNKRFNFSTDAFEDPLPFLNENSDIVYSDEKSGRSIVVESFYEQEQNVYYSRFIVYEGNEIVFEQQFEKGKNLSFPKIMNLDDNKLVFYQSYAYDSRVRLDGYYMLDLKTKGISMLQTDSDNYGYSRNDFFIYDDQNSFVSVQPHEIVKIKMKE